MLKIRKRFFLIIYPLSKVIRGLYHHKLIKSVASHARTPGPDTGQPHDILLSPRCCWEFGQQSKSLQLFVLLLWLCSYSY